MRIIPGDFDEFEGEEGKRLASALGRIAQFSRWELPMPQRQWEQLKCYPLRSK